MSEKAETSNLNEAPSAAPQVEAAAATPVTQEPTHDADVDLDLDDLVPSGRRIRFQGKSIAINNPTVEDVLKLQKSMQLTRQLAGQMSALQSEQMGKFEVSADVKAKIAKVGEQSERATLESIEIIRSLSPDLKDAQFTPQQVGAMIQFILSMTMTSNQAELKKRGITPVELPKESALL